MKQTCFGLIVLLLVASFFGCANSVSPSSPSATTYTVTYNANGATGGAVPTDSTQYLSGATVTVKNNTGSLVRTGYAFAGWNTAANGSGIAYATGSSCVISANVTMYAQWANATYTVTYNGNGATGGTPPTDSKQYASGATVTVLVNTGSLAKSGSTFTGWNTAAAGTGTSYSVGATFAITANVTLYAQWTTSPTYTVTYVANVGSGTATGSVPIDTNNYIQGATVTVMGAGTLGNTGYTFAGWNTAAGGTGSSYAANATFKMGAANVILYAQWTPFYTVTYFANGATGTAPTDSTQYKSGVTVAVLGAGSLAKSGSTFTGWNTAAAGTGTSYLGGSSFIITGNITLYAQWTTSAAYTVTYNSNGAAAGTVPTDPNTYLQGATVAVLGNPGSLAETGYTFGGWSMQQSNGTPINSFTMGSSNVTLYAVWLTSGQAQAQTAITAIASLMSSLSNPYPHTNLPAVGNTTAYTQSSTNAGVTGSGSVTASLSGSNTVYTYSVTETMTNATDPTSGYTMSGAVSEQFILTVDSSNNFVSGSGTSSGSGSLTGGPVTAWTASLTFTVSGFNGAPSYAGTINCNGTPYSALLFNFASSSGTLGTVTVE